MFRPACVALFAILCAAGMAASAQESRLRGFSGFWQPKFGQEPLGRVLLEQLPDSALLINDAGGIELHPGQFAGLQLTERALAEVEAYDPRSMLSADLACIPPSVAFYMQAPFPMEIHEGREFIVFRMEYYDQVRIIFLDGRGHPPADAPHSKSGHSVGHWEEDTLVVDTTHIAAGTFMNNGFDHSENMRITERFRLSPDGNTLWSTQLYEDPETFEGLAARYIAFVREPDGYIYPFECNGAYLAPE